MSRTWAEAYKREALCQGLRRRASIPLIREGVSRVGGHDPPNKLGKYVQLASGHTSSSTRMGT